ncbi:MAG: CRISPR-associated endonuclease Cas6 [Bacteroidia bacterium]
MNSPLPQTTPSLLRVIFDDEMEAHEIPALRGAIAARAGYDHILFHNHQDEGYRYAYPLIQYKRIGRRPAVVCVGRGVEEIHHFFQQPDWSVEISGRRLPMRILRMDLALISLALLDAPRTYAIRKWVALNPENWNSYQQIGSVAEQRDFLARKLTGNMLSYAKGIGWHVDGRIETTLLDADIHTVRIKSVSLTAFDARFRTNVSLPDDIGLGGKVSLGYGTVRAVAADA